MRRAALAVLAIAWLLGHAWLLWLLNHSQQWVDGDLAYFASSLHAAGRLGLAHTLVEYPLPAVGVIAVPYLAAVGDPDRYRVLFHTLALLVDLSFALALWWASRRASLLPVALWVLAVPLLGATSLARFDLLPGVLCGLAVLCLPRAPVPAGVLVSVATGVKLWPALLVPPVLALRRTRWRILGAVSVTGGVLVLGSLVLAGVGRLLSPLAYQADRGLQIESLFATPVMLGWSAHGATWQVAFAASHSYEIVGPDVDGLLAASTVAVAAYVALLLLTWARLLWLARAGLDVDLETVVWLVLASVSGFVVLGKVFSPQYLLWLLPVSIAATVVVPSRGLRWWTCGLLLAAVLTQLVFPVGYTVLINHLPGVVRVVVLLSLRNLTMATLLVVAAWHAGRGLASRSGRPVRAVQRASAGQ
jgi:hypothetical protein